MMKYASKYSENLPVGLYIRTRVKEIDGKIAKANYVKLSRHISIGAGGFIGFIYYFNPAVNDRNLEFVGQPPPLLASKPE